ncbi:MAG: EscU/YscU/HrcU family type III secretion system export apparatus switch protein [Planctomycetes bacterium]|nr:EscU/YscU/HrcU family type III secretion system export apparatus switch protein [Planctomycetota bacterium]
MEKTEDPSGRKLSQAEEKGDLPQSAELSAALQVLLAGGLFAALLPATLNQLGEGLKFGLGPSLAGSAENLGSPAEIGLRIRLAGELALRAGLPLLLGFVGFGLFTTFIQRRPSWNLEKLAPKSERFSVANNLGRIVSLEGLARLGLTLAKGVGIGGVIWLTYEELLPQIGRLGGGGLSSGFSSIGDLGAALWWRGGAALLVFALGDVLLVRWTRWRRLRMSKQEIRDEHRQEEGDPQIRGQRRARQREIAQRRLMLTRVAEADVVVTNPTHVAVALRYDPTRMAAPILLAKGVDTLAAEIRTRARLAGVPLVGNPPLARAINQSVKVGGHLPEELYAAVAELLAFVYSLQRGQA